MEETLCDVHYFGLKLSKVQFLQSENLSKSTDFVIGTYDEHTQNQLALCCLTTQNTEECETGLVEVSEEIEHLGDVLDMDVNRGMVTTASSTGDVNLYRCDAHKKQLIHQHTYKGQHTFGSGKAAPCTGVSLDNRLASCGEDGSLHVYDVNCPKPSLSLDGYDQSAMSSVMWIGPYQLATTNTCGQLKLFDTRSNKNKPSQTYVVSGDLSPLTCIDKHPSQNHLVAVGSYSGSFSLYDLRKEDVPITNVQPGDEPSPITSLRFHSHYPDNLFMSTMDGEIFQWSRTDRVTNDDEEMNPWLLADAMFNKLNINRPMDSCNVNPAKYCVNSLDVRNNCLISCTDNGAINTFLDLDFTGRHGATV